MPLNGVSAHHEHARHCCHGGHSFTSAGESGRLAAVLFWHRSLSELLFFHSVPLPHTVGSVRRRLRRPSGLCHWRVSARVSNKGVPERLGINSI